jgi:hydrogenase expression/formation protein HypD
LLPGHVSTIIGVNAYAGLAKYRIPGVIAGFEPVEILHAIASLLEGIHRQSPEVVNCYARAVTNQGVTAALTLFDHLFEPDTALWRGIGFIPDSGYRLRKSFAEFDAAEKYQLPPFTDADDASCACGNILKGLLLPPECPNFAKTCTPDHPIGPCMVSGEGSCAAAYRFQ